MVRTTIEENPTCKSPLGRPRLRWKVYVKAGEERIMYHGEWQKKREMSGEEFVWRYVQFRFLDEFPLPKNIVGLLLYSIIFTLIFFS